jgi:hypothetical protein
MVTFARRRRVEDDEGFDYRVYDRRFYPRRVYRDGKGPSVPLYLTDARRGVVRPRSVFDGALHRPGCVVEALRGRASLGDATLADAQRRIDDAYAARSNWLADQWTYNKPEALVPVAAGDARAAYIKRISNAWRKPTPLSHLRRDQDDDEDDDDPDAETDPEQARQAYLERVWSAQAAIQPGSPDAAAQVEAMQRRMSVSQPNVTGESVAAERRRYRPRDAAAIADTELAYAEYCRRIENGWRR